MQDFWYKLMETPRRVVLFVFAPCYGSGSVKSVTSIPVDKNGGTVLTKGSYGARSTPTAKCQDPKPRSRPFFGFASAETIFDVAS